MYKTHSMAAEWSRSILDDHINLVRKGKSEKKNFLNVLNIEYDKGSEQPTDGTTKCLPFLVL